MFVGIETDEHIAPAWKLNNIPLDKNTAVVRRAHVTRMLAGVMEASAVFCEARIV
jgi:hypothetical protein